MIGEATRLGLLSLRGCYLISDLVLEHLADGDIEYCLATLYLNKCDRITDNGIVHLQKLVSLRTLCLSKCGVKVNIIDYGVVALCELPYEVLYLDYLVNLMDISLHEIGSNLVFKLENKKRYMKQPCGILLFSLSNIHL
ncbi:leucine-rich repeat, cysteine-containing subtype protein [Tanacetum coccineum]